MVIHNSMPIPPGDQEAGIPEGKRTETKDAKASGNLGNINEWSHRVYTRYQKRHNGLCKECKEGVNRRLREEEDIGG